MKKQTRKAAKGFTLSELLIVVAIIAVLTAVAIPVFATQLEKSREATDAANIRGLYAEVLTLANETGGAVNKDDALGTVPLKQTIGGWTSTETAESLAQIAKVSGEPAKGGIAKVFYDPENADPVQIVFDGEPSGSSNGSGNSTTLSTGTPMHLDLSGYETPLNKYQSLKVNIPETALVGITGTTDLTITIKKNPGSGHGQGNQPAVHTISLSSGAAIDKTYGLNMNNEGSIDITFNKDIDENIAKEIIKYITLSKDSP